MCKALRRSGSTPTLPSLPLFLSLVFCLLSSFPRTMSLFMLPARSLSPHFSHLTFHPPPATPTPLSSLYHPLCHRGNFLPSWQACNCCPLSLSSPLSVSLLLLSLFDTVNKQVELAVIVDASAEVPGNE